MAAAEFIVDDVRTSDLAEDMTIGKVTDLLEAEVRSGAALHRILQTDKAEEYEAYEQSVLRWRQGVHTTLTKVFTSGAPALRFAVSASFVQYHPRIVTTVETFSIATGTLLDIQAQHLEKREQVSRAAHELAREVAHRKEIADLLRDNHSMTEGLWDKMVKDQFAAPSIARMIGLGLAPKAIWALLKAGGGWWAG